MGRPYTYIIKGKKYRSQRLSVSEFLLCYSVGVVSGISVDGFSVTVPVFSRISTDIAVTITESFEDSS